MPNQMRNRVKEFFPTVLLTLLSIVQAIALELLWGKIVGIEALYEVSIQSFLTWAQILATFFGLMLIWVIYAGNVMRFSWTPNISDSLYPFLVGVMEFWAVEAIGVSTIGYWLLAMGGIFAVMTTISQLTMRSARADAENSEFFKERSPASLIDFVPQIIIVGIFLGTGITLIAYEMNLYVSTAIMLLSLTFITWQFKSTVNFWEASIGSLDKEDT